MQIKIKVYHLILGLGSFCVLGLAAHFSRTTPDPAPQIVRPSMTAPHVETRVSQKPVVRAPIPLKYIALTFDDGPHPKYTDELLQNIFGDGHEIANHTYSHPDLRRLSPTEVAQELEKTDELVEAVIHQKMRFFRPPGGQYNESVLELGKKLGYKMALWSSFPQDHLSPAPQLISERVLKSAQNCGVILLHSGVDNTLTALPGLINSLRKEGYVFVTLTENASRARDGGRAA